MLGLGLWLAQGSSSFRIFALFGGCSLPALLAGVFFGIFPGCPSGGFSHFDGLTALPPSPPPTPPWGSQRRNLCQMDKHELLLHVEFKTFFKAWGVGQPVLKVSIWKSTLLMQMGQSKLSIEILSLHISSNWFANNQLFYKKSWAIVYFYSLWD